ncbi:MAG: tetratricopeptide repeat protein [Gammaproteobacteria bacterium]|nr:tetratricopeptide repeat protein [Gammaproteobacteria bacterium]
MKYFLLSIIFFVLYFTIATFSEIYKWVDENGYIPFSDKPHSTVQEIKPQNTIKQENEESNVAINKKQNVTVSYKSLLNSNVLKLRSMLKKKEFNALNEAIAQLDAAYKSNKLSEDTYFTAFDAFNIKNEKLSSTFDLWVSSTPKAYQPYLARGIFQYHIGWLHRGGDWSSETKDEKKLQLSKYLSKTSDDILKSLNIKDDSMISYYYLMRVATTRGQQDESEQLLRKTLKINASSYRIRAEFLRSLTPRWGGSFEAMQAYLIDASRAISEYPQLKVLEGYIYNEAGDIRMIDKQYNSANDYFSKSLEFGDYHATLFKRGKNNNRREEYADSLRDLNSAIDMNFEKPLYYYWRARTLISLNEFDKAMNDIQASIQLDPYYKYSQNTRKWLAAKFHNEAYTLRESQNNESAVDNYTKAIRLDPKNGDLYQGRARAHIQERDLSSALADMKKAIDVDPDNYHHYALIDYILIKNNDYDQTIKYWKQYIKRHPDDGRAYVEVGGTYYRKGDIKSAIKYAKISADLGNLEGIEAYEKFKHMIQ